MWRRLWAAIRAAVFGTGGRRGASAAPATEPVEVAPTPAPKPTPEPEPVAPLQSAPEPAVVADPWPDLALLRALAPEPERESEPVPVPAEGALAEGRFWALMDHAAAVRADGSEAQAEALRTALEALSPEELVAFEAALAVQMKRAERWDLWGAAYVALGGASDDGFVYARLWLIGQGREVFERVLADPDALAEVLPEDVEAALEFESLMYVAGDVWCEKTGREADEWPGAGVDGVGDPAGEPFEEDPDWLAKRYPKLWKRFAEASLA